MRRHEENFKQCKHDPTFSGGDLGFSLPKSVLDLLNSTVQHTKENLEDTNKISEPVFW